MSHPEFLKRTFFILKRKSSKTGNCPSCYFFVSKKLGWCSDAVAAPPQFFDRDGGKTAISFSFTPVRRFF